MSIKEFCIEFDARLGHDRSLRHRGNVLVVATMFFALVLTAVLTTLTLVTEQVQNVRISAQELRARKAAESGVHDAIADLKGVRDLSLLSTPFGGIDNQDLNGITGPGGYSPLWMTKQLSDTAGNSIAEYDVFLDVTNQVSSSRDVTITCYAYVPNKADYLNKVRDAARSDAHCTVRIEFGDSEVFDYSYFINHWGWFYGNTIVANGDVRSNGQFDFGGYSATVNGSPRYDSSSGSDLIGYKDDNNDGVEDGSDGGAYSGYQILSAQNVQGMGGQSQNQHENQGNIEMPNISDLTHYESQAISSNATIKIGSTTYVDGVLGDDSGEKQHLYLEGTAANPIVIDGPVVVKGSVIIKGHVTGQGTIFSGGNVYVAGDITYADPPATTRPSSNDQATVEAWREANKDKDALGLFAREHVVVGDYTNSTWQSYVSGWVNHSLNESSEDAGVDGVQNTEDGPDGISGTSDDDVLEGDGNWTVDTYTAADAARGIIPPGKNVGDTIPGSGEDIDGDGVQDGTTQMSDFNIPASLTNSNWEGNLSGSTTYDNVSTNYISKLDASFYTNHTFAALMLNYGGDIEMNGSVVSRNESIIYGANRILMNHDERLTGQGGDFFGFYLPQDWLPINILQWEFDKPIVIPAEELTNPTSIAEFWIGTTQS